MPSLSQKQRLSDVLLWEVSPLFCRASAKVKNGSGANVDILDPTGYPVKSDGIGGYALAFAGDEANVIGLLMFNDEFTVNAGLYSATLLPVLVRGPAVYDPLQLPANDAAGAAFNNATLQTALKTLNFVAKSEPSTQYTQTS